MTIEIEIGIEAKVADHGRHEQLARDVKHPWVGRWGVWISVVIRDDNEKRTYRKFVSKRHFQWFEMSILSCLILSITDEFLSIFVCDVRCRHEML